MGNLKTKQGRSEIVMAAIHSGHIIRPELLPFLKLTEAERLREEDPFTNEWIKISANQIRVLSSRFEVDINRSREKAVYLDPNDAWGLEVWRDQLPKELIARSLQVYDEIYASLEVYFDELLAENNYLIVYDIHSYNHRRAGVDKYASVKENPEINVGTANVNRKSWAHVIDTLIERIESYNFEGRHLSVGENVRFRGGYFGEWLNNRYSDMVCPISIEVKKFFMNEWTGECIESQVRHINEMLIQTLLPVTSRVAINYVP